MAPGWKPQEPKPATPPAARPSSAGVLKVTLVEGKELLAVDKGGTSDPFAVLQLLDQYDNPHGKPQKSKPIKKTLAPQWKQSFQFPLPATVVGFKLRVVVQDQDRGLFGAKPATNLGTAYLSMAMLAPGTVQDNWFKLERVGDMQRVSGAVRVAWARYAVGDDRGSKRGRKASVDHLVDVDGKATPAEEAIDEAVDDDDLSEAGVAKRDAENAAAGLPPGVDIAALDNQPDKPPNELHVVLMRASGLKVMDKSLFGRGSSDPYVTLSCDGETSKSTIKRKELNPVWLETFKFPAFDSKTSLKLTVFDHDDLGKDDFMGRVHIRMKDLKDKALKRMTLKLEGESGRADEDRGEVEFFAAWRTNGKLMVDLPTSVLQLTKQPERHADEAPNELIVVVIRATRLLAMDTKMFGNKPGTSDPYVKLECDGSVFTTATKQKTTKPLWLEVVRIPVDPYSHAFLECSVFDKDLVGADDFMGKMKVPMDTFLDRRGRRRWYTLSGADGKRDKDRGRLEIYTIWRYTSTLKLEVPTELFVDGYPFIDERFPPTCLQVFVARGKGLQAVDVSLTGQATSSDPYVRVSCEGQVAQTSVKEKTLEPRWKEILTLGPVEDETSDLVLTVFDHDVASADDKMGEIRLPLALLANKAPVRRWLPLGGSIAPAEYERVLDLDTERPPTPLPPPAVDGDDSSISSLETFGSAPGDGAGPPPVGTVLPPTLGPPGGANPAPAPAPFDVAEESSDDDDRGQSTRRGAMLKSKKKRRGGVVALGADRDAPAVQHKPAHHDEHERLNLDGTRHQSSKDLAAQRPKVRHDHSPLDYVEFTHPDKRIGNIDVWVAWRHDPQFMYVCHCCTRSAMQTQSRRACSLASSTVPTRPRGRSPSRAPSAASRSSSPSPRPAKVVVVADGSAAAEDGESYVPPGDLLSWPWHPSDGPVVPEWAASSTQEESGPSSWDLRLEQLENDVGGWEMKEGARPKFREERLGKPATPSMEQDYRVDPREAPSHLAALERWALAADVRMARMGADERAEVLDTRRRVFDALVSLTDYSYQFAAFDFGVSGTLWRLHSAEEVVLALEEEVGAPKLRRAGLMFREAHSPGR